MNANDILKNIWGHHTFRPSQEEIIQAVNSGKDVVAILPTGGGKSICFQIPSLMKEGICIVISPLIALMQDQVKFLRTKGIYAVTVHGGLVHQEIDILLDNCVYGKQKFLYVSPERLQTDLFQDRFQKMNVNLIAVDEAHCISQWGYDFRPPYLHIADLRVLKPNVPIIALTASATSNVTQDIVEKLKLNTPLIIQESFARKNISWVVREVEQKQKKGLSILKKVEGSAIIYVRSRKSTQALSTYFHDNGITSTFYHAGLPHHERTLRQADWLNNKCRLIVATNAFGMGINKANVRTVIHFDLPENLESYYQEAGRAGRDGKRAYAIILSHPNDVNSLRHKVNLSHPTIENIQRVYQALGNHFQLAEGAGQGESFDFDITHFCEKFSWPVSNIYPTLKKLEEIGLIQFNESFHRPSRLHFSIDPKKIYEFQVANEHFDAILKTALRLYGGELYTDFVVISEQTLATTLQLPVSEIKTQLHHLHQLQLLRYEPANDQPQIIFILPRKDPNHMSIDRKKIDERRTLHLAKVESMINYVTKRNKCRMQLIQEYFGEFTAQLCGICDVCLSQKKENESHDLLDYENQINYYLNQKPLPADELLKQVAPKNEPLFLKALREMVEEKKIFYDEHWFLHIPK